MWFPIKNVNEWGKWVVNWSLKLKSSHSGPPFSHTLQSDSSIHKICFWLKIPSTVTLTVVVIHLWWNPCFSAHFLTSPVHPATPWRAPHIASPGYTVQEFSYASRLDKPGKGRSWVAGSPCLSAGRCSAVHHCPQQNLTGLVSPALSTSRMIGNRSLCPTDGFCV